MIYSKNLEHWLILEERFKMNNPDLPEEEALKIVLEEKGDYYDEYSKFHQQQKIKEIISKSSTIHKIQFMLTHLGDEDTGFYKTHTVLKNMSDEIQWEFKQSNIYHKLLNYYSADVLDSLYPQTKILLWIYSNLWDKTIIFPNKIFGVNLSRTLERKLWRVTKYDLAEKSRIYPGHILNGEIDLQVVRTASGILKSQFLFIATTNYVYHPFLLIKDKEDFEQRKEDLLNNLINISEVDENCNELVEDMLTVTHKRLDKMERNIEMYPDKYSKRNIKNNYSNGKSKDTFPVGW